MPRDIPIVSKTLSLPPVVRLKRNRRMKVLRLIGLADRNGRLKLPRDIIAWRLRVRMETLTVIEQALINGRLLTISQDGVYQFAQRLLDCPDAYLSREALDDPCFARLTEAECYTVTQLMAISDEHGCIPLSDEDIAYNQHTRPDRWMARAEALLALGTMKREGGLYYLADVLFGGCEVDIEDEDEEEEEPPVLTYGGLRPRYHSDSPEERRRRQRLSRARKKAEIDGASTDVTSPKQEDVTSQNGSDVTSPSHGRARLDSNRLESIDSINSLSYIDSNRSIEGEDPPPDVTSHAQMLPPELLPADVVQMLVEKSEDGNHEGAMSLEHAYELVDKFDPLKCLAALLMLSKQGARSPGGFLNAAITGKSSTGKAVTIKPEFYAEAKKLLSPRVPKPPPKSASPAASKPDKPAGMSPMQEARERLTEDERKQLRIEAAGNLSAFQKPHYEKAMSEGSVLGPILLSALLTEEDKILAEWIDQARKAVGE